MWRWIHWKITYNWFKTLQCDRLPASPCGYVCCFSVWIPDSNINKTSINHQGSDFLLTFFLIRFDGGSWTISGANLYLSPLDGECRVLTFAAESLLRLHSSPHIRWTNPLQFLLSFPHNLHLYHQQHNADPLWPGLIGSNSVWFNYSGSLKGKSSTCCLNWQAHTQTLTPMRGYIVPQCCSGVSPLFSEQISSFNEGPPFLSAAIWGTAVHSLTFKSVRAVQLNYSLV